MTVEDAVLLFYKRIKQEDSKPTDKEGQAWRNPRYVPRSRRDTDNAKKRSDAEAEKAGPQPWGNYRPAASATKIEGKSKVRSIVVVNGISPQGPRPQSPNIRTLQNAILKGLLIFRQQPIDKKTVPKAEKIVGGLLAVSHQDATVNGTVEIVQTGDPFTDDKDIRVTLTERHDAPAEEP
jgi:hypothetical protein